MTTALPCNQDGEIPFKLLSLQHRMLSNRIEQQLLIFADLCGYCTLHSVCANLIRIEEGLITLPEINSSKVIKLIKSIFHQKSKVEIRVLIKLCYLF
jgi:hypothetical protein